MALSLSSVFDMYPRRTAHGSLSLDYKASRKKSENSGRFGSRKPARDSERSDDLPLETELEGAVDETLVQVGSTHS